MPEPYPQALFLENNTMVILALILLAILFLAVLLSVPVLWLAGKILRAPRATLVRALIATVLMTILGVFFAAVSGLVGVFLTDLAGGAVAAVLELMILLMQMTVACMVIKVAFGTTVGRAFAIWLATLFPYVMLAVVLVLPLKWFVMEAYVVPTNAMAPTIVGYHREAACPHCQGTLILPAALAEDQFRPPGPDDRPGICVTCRKTSVKLDAPAATHGPDRILVSKLHKPVRWDMIVFRYPPEPKTKYVFRLVGLPGEKIYIKSGLLWVNDQKVDLPAEIADTEYTTVLGDAILHHGTEEHPTILGPDEFFVLGDFSRSSSDSRFWGPVPGENIEAVVCGCYWPMGRLKVFR